MEEQILLQVKLRDNNIIVEGGAEGTTFPPLMMVGILEQVKQDILLDMKNGTLMERPEPSGKKYDA